MRKPDKKTVFMPISKLNKYSNKDKYYCVGVVFSPETENQHFDGCPPYIEVRDRNDHDGDSLYFEVPEIVAYYAKTHPCYTMQGKENDRLRGERDMQDRIKSVLGI